MSSKRVHHEDEDEISRNVRTRFDDSGRSNEISVVDLDGDDQVVEDEDRTIRQEQTVFTANNGVYTFILNLSKHFDYEEVSEVNTTVFFRSDDEKPDATKSTTTATLGAEKESHFGKRVGYLQGYLLPRPHPIFYEIADSISGELQELSVMLFDCKGHANRIKDVIEDLTPGQVSEGGFLNIESVEVGEGHQGKCDLGLRIIHETFCFLRKEWNIASMVPCLLSVHAQQWPEENDRFDIARVRDRNFTTEQEDGVNLANVKIKKHFARLGFKQVGRNVDQCHVFYITLNKYFGSSEDESSDAAIARWVSKEDADKIEIYEAPAPHIPKGLDKELHDAVSEISENGSEAVISERVRQIESLIQRGASIHEARALHKAAALPLKSNTILRTLVTLGGDVNAPDENGNRPLHVAAACFRANAIEYLLYAGSERDVVNDKGETAMQSLQGVVRSMSDYGATFNLTRYTPKAVEVNTKLEAMVALMEKEHRDLLIDGWMSPRMRTMLMITADLEAESIALESEQFQKNEKKSVAECFELISTIHYIPPEVIETNQDGFNRSFVDGWRIIFESISAILKLDKSPTVERIQSHIAEGEYDYRKYQYFTKKGGQIEFALDLLFGVTQDVLYGESNEWEYKEHKDTIEKEPATALDGAFDVARVKCFGITDTTPMTEWGPYRHQEEEYD